MDFTWKGVEIIVDVVDGLFYAMVSGEHVARPSLAAMKKVIDEDQRGKRVEFPALYVSFGTVTPIVITHVNGSGRMVTSDGKQIADYDESKVRRADHHETYAEIEAWLKEKSILQHSLHDIDKRIETLIDTLPRVRPEAILAAMQGQETS